MNDFTNKDDGFTLLEVLVVIAIIALLTLVLFPTARMMIARAQLAQDRQVAARMNDVLHVYYIDHPKMQGVNFSAYAMRTVLNGFSEDDFDFTPKSRHAGFFFMQGTDGGYIEVKHYHDAFKAMPPSIELHAVRTPETLFGADMVLLSETGSSVAELVHAIRHHLPTSFIEQALTLSFLETRHYDDAFKAWLHTLVDESLKQSFHPNNIAYVTHEDWITHQFTITRVLFEPGLSHIPPLRTPIEFNAMDTIVLPLTVKTVEAGAFTGTSLNDVLIKQVVAAPLYSETGAFTPSQAAQLNSIPWCSDTFVDDYTHELVFKQGAITLEHLTKRHTFTAMGVVYQTSTITIRLFNEMGLVGMAVLPYE